MKRLWSAFRDSTNRSVNAYFTRRDTMLNMDVELFEALVEILRGNEKKISISSIYEKFFGLVFFKSTNPSFLTEEVRNETAFTHKMFLSGNLSEVVSDRLVQGQLNVPGLGVGSPYWVLSPKGDKLVSTYDGSTIAVNQYGFTVGGFIKRLAAVAGRGLSFYALSGNPATITTTLNKWHTAGLIYSTVNEVFSPLSVPTFNSVSKK